MIELHWTLVASTFVLFAILVAAFALAYRKLRSIQDRITSGAGFFFHADGRKFFVVQVGGDAPKEDVSRRE
jgi:hypothetical protein